MDVMKTIGVVFLWLVGGYIAGIPIGWFLVDTFSSNRHDRGAEAAMSSAFFYAPIISIIAAIIGGILYSRRTA